MPSYSTIVLALSAVAAAAPLAARDVCGVAPSASSTSKTPIETFADAQTAEQCYTDCTANDSCKSFLFGLVDGTIKCQLFDVPAAQIPKQDSSNLVAFDKACSAIPNVKPTTANPKGLATGASDNSKTNSEASNSNSKTNTNTEQQEKTEKQQKTEKKQTKRSTCGATPAGSGNTQPFNTPANINSLQACVAACKQNRSCKS
jgi:hypothetical protein